MTQAAYSIIFWQNQQYQAVINMSGHFCLLLGNIHDIRVPVPGTSASEFEAKDTGNKKKGEDKNINWNLQVLQHNN